MNIQQLTTSEIIQLAYQISQELDVPIYLVGGAVRDSLMGFFYGKDYDFALGEKWEKVTRLFANKARGKIISWDFNQKRVIVRRGEGLITVDFSRFKGEDIQNDLLARDFTINSMAVLVGKVFTERDPEVIDPLFGRKHIAEKIIQADAPTVFDHDPLRILRAIRFATAFNFSIEKKTKSLIRKKASLVSIVAPERTKREFFAILGLAGAATAIQELLQLGVVQHLIPEISQFSLIRQGPPHQYNLLQHSLETIKLLAALIENPPRPFNGHESPLRDYCKEYIEEGIITRRSLLLFAGLLHDSGKILTKTYAGHRIRFLGHEAEGSKINQEIARRMLLGKKARSALATITKNHMRILQLSTIENISARAITRLLRDIKEAPLEVLLLALADTQATSTDRNYNNAREKVSQLVQLLMNRYFASEHIMSCADLVTGNDIMEIMGIAEGPAVGALLHEIHECEKKGIFNSRAEVIEWLKRKQNSKLNW